MQALEVVVYGSDAPCPGCFHAPSSKETKEWIEAAVQRKFPGQALPFRYVDIENPQQEKDNEFCERILAEEFFYPLVVIDGKVVGEGNPRLKTIFTSIESHGYEPASLKG
ncbi:MAG TPA: DUF1462 family protein [Bacillales bacterium]|nr:DUF1462 family protein [Bacillales bacterium]